MGNRGLISPKALARVDLDRTRLSAEIFTNYIGKTQGALTIRPGTKYFGSSHNDTGAAWIEFVASTDDVALLELTNDTGTGLGLLRSWQGSDAHNLALLERPYVDTTVTLSDTGWVEESTGGAIGAVQPDAIPVMTDYTTEGVTISADSELGSRPAWQAADVSTGSLWSSADGSLPNQLQIDFGSGNEKAIVKYTIRAGGDPSDLDEGPRNWTLQGNHSDTGSWITEDTRSSQSWSTGQQRTYELSDTGSPDAWRYWRLNVSAVNGDNQTSIADFQLFEAVVTNQAVFSSGALTLNASSIGAVAKVTKRVIVDTGDFDVEHSVAINIAKGPVTFRIGSTSGDDDYISETSLGTGYHNLAFTPSTNFHITLQSDGLADREVTSLTIGDSGTVEVTTPWTASNLGNIRYDQSADVVYANTASVRQQKIERRGTGRSWSVVEYEPNDGPFLAAPSSSAKMSVSHYYGNTTMNSNVPFFTPNHVGALVRIFHEGQSGEWPLGALDAKTDVIEVTGISDTGSPGTNSERRIVFTISGTFAGTITIERSFDGPDIGFKPISSHLGTASDTGGGTRTIDDPDDNIRVWYRAIMSAYTSGVAIVDITYLGGGVTGIARVTGYNSNTDVDVEVLRRFSDTGASDNWQQGYWSAARGYPTAVALHGGRLYHAQGGSLFGSVSDDFESFDETVEGDAGPLIRTLGSGPVDNIHYLLSLLRLIIGTAGAELALRSSSLDEPVTPTNASVRDFSTQGSANIRAIKMDTRAIYVQRSGQRVFMVGFGVQNNAFGDYENLEFTLLVPDLLVAGIVSIAIQRQPDTRIHFVLADGTVAVLTYEPTEEVLAWVKWETDGIVEQAMVLPGASEDAVYYHIQRTINGETKRYLEKWAMESECLGDTGLSWLADCAVSFSDTGRATSFSDVAEHLAGENVIAWGDLDTGSTPYVDLSPDVAGVQTTYAVDTGGDISFSSLTDGVNQGVIGLPYTATWKSTKMAYAAEAGTALAQMKRIARMAFILYKTHPRGIQYGSDTGHLDYLPQMIGGKPVDLDEIFQEFDEVSMPMDSTNNPDSRVVLRSKAPRPCTILAAVPSVETHDRA
jgi:hypothetical protein